MGYKVVMTLFRYPGLPQNEAEYKRLNAEFLKVPCSTEEEIIEAVREADVAVTAMQPYTRRVIESMEKCRLISVIGIGYEGVDIRAATERGVLVSNVPYYCLDEVADHAMALILACNRRLVRIHQAVREGKWDSLEKPHIRYNIMPGLHRLRGQTLGLIGFGNIARTLVPKARGFGLDIIAYDPYVPRELMMAHFGVEKVGLEELLRRSDFISIHAALTEENRKMLGREQFRMMKPTAYVINTARGGIIDEEALIEALKEGRIAGAALDVTDPEPPTIDNPLLKMDNVILTAHTAQFSEEAIADMRRMVEENIFSVLRGELPPGLINRDAVAAYRRRFGPGE